MVKSVVTVSQVMEMNIAERLELIETRIPVQSDVYQLLAKNDEQRKTRRKTVEMYEKYREVVYYANGEVDVPSDKPITMSQIREFDVEQLIELAKRHVRVSSMVYMILDQENKNCVSRKEIVRRYGSGPEVVYYADGQVKTPGFTLCTLLKPTASPIVTIPTKE